MSAYTPKIELSCHCGTRVYAKGLCRKCYDKKRGPHSTPATKKRFYAKHRTRLLASAHQQQLANPIRGLVVSHYGCIRNGYSTYKGMPFFDGWNPDKGGSYQAGERWIIENLGHRLGSGKEYQLHIIDRRLGFVPGNLCWVPLNKHKQEEMMNRLLLENQNLKIENEKLKETVC